jgi:hypothetical protein
MPLRNRGCDPAGRAARQRDPVLREAYGARQTLLQGPSGGRLPAAVRDAGLAKEALQAALKGSLETAS